MKIKPYQIRAVIESAIHSASSQKVNARRSWANIFTSDNQVVSHLATPSVQSIGRANFASVSPNPEAKTTFQEARDAFREFTRTKLTPEAAEAYVQSTKKFTRNKDFLPDLLKWAGTPLVLASLISLYQSGNLPEQWIEFLDSQLKQVPLFKKPKVLVAPESFDSGNLVSRKAARELEHDFDTYVHEGQGPMMLALVGPAGSGKSEIALEYADKYSQQLAKRSANSDKVVYVLHCEDKEILKQEYSKLAHRLGIDETEENVRSEKVNSFFRTRSNWLLVFDNVEHYEDIKAFLPTAGHRNGKVIITAQKAQIFNKHGVRSIDIYSDRYRFDENEALALFEKKFKRQFNDQEKQNIYMLASVVGYMPLALMRAVNLALIGCGKQKNFIEMTGDLITGINAVGDKTDKILHLNKMLISELNQEEQAVLAFITYSNLDAISTIAKMQIDIGKLAKAVFGATSTRNSSPEIFSRLRVLNVLTGSRGDRSHRVMQKALLGNIAQQQGITGETLELKILEAITAVYTDLKMSNFHAYEQINNALYLPHVQSYFAHVEHYYYTHKTPVNQKQLLKLYLESIHALSKAGTNMHSISPFAARQILERAKEKCLKVAKEAGVAAIQPEDGIIDSIVVQFGNTELVDLYAGILYQLGRSYLYTKDLSKLQTSYALMEEAQQFAAMTRKKLGKKVGTITSQYDQDKGFVIEQNGLLYLMQEPYHAMRKWHGGVSCSGKKSRGQQQIDLDLVIGKHQSFKGQIPFSKDSTEKAEKDYYNRSLITCVSQIARAYLQLASITEDPSLVSKHLKAAEENINEALANAKENDLQRARYLNIKAQIFLAQNKLDAAHDVYQESISLSEKLARGCTEDLAVSHEGLAHINEHNRQYQQALEHVDISSNVQKSLGRTLTHQMYADTSYWQDRLFYELVERQYEHERQEIQRN